MDPTKKENLQKLIKAAVSSKYFGSEEIVSELISEAVLQITRNGDFTADYVRVAKVPGTCLEESTVVRGLAIPIVPRGIVQRMENCKIAVFTCPIELRETETKGTTLLENA